MTSQSASKLAGESARVKLAGPALLIIATLLVIGTARLAARPAIKVGAASTQMAFFAYWSEDNGFKSTVVINNASDAGLTVVPTLYNLGGQSLAVTPIVLAARQEMRANVADWLAQSGAGSEFKQGNLVLSYDAPDAAYLGAQVIVTDPTLGLSFDLRDEMPMSFKSSRLEGLWWKPDGDSRYDLIVSNMEDSSVTATIRASGGQGQNGDLSFDVPLAPHQTHILSLGDTKLPFSTRPGAGRLGGISITHTGAPGAVLACGILAKKPTGFSSHFPFEDPAESRSQVLAGAHLLIDKPDLSGFPANSSFTSIALLRNASASPIEVTPKVSLSMDGRPRTVALSPRMLEANQVEALDIGAELKRSGIRGAVVGCGLTLTSNGEPGALVAHVTSFDQPRNHVFDVPMKDPGIAMNRLSGSYPWNIDDDYQSIIHVRNTTDEKARFTIQLDFDGGSYTLPLQLLEPQQEAAIDIRQLRDSQLKDSIGRVIPVDVTQGQATWSERGRQALIGRTEVFSVSRGTSSSFSCGGPCCPPNTESIYTTPDSFTGGVGDGGAAQAFEMQRRACDGAQFGPFEISFQALWSSTNTQVVTVSGPEINFGCVGVGQADVNVSYQGTQWLGSELNQICEENDVAFFTSVPVTVKPHITSISPDSGVQGLACTVTFTGTGFVAPASVSVGGSGVTVTAVQVVSSVQMSANFTLALDAAAGNHSVTVTANGQPSNAVTFFVQVPTSLGISIGTLRTHTGGAITNCVGNTVVSVAYGYSRLITCTVLDQNGNAIRNSGMTAAEDVIKVSSNPSSIVGDSFISGVAIDANGQFCDVQAFFTSAAPAPQQGEFLKQKQRIDVAIPGKAWTVRWNCINKQYNDLTITLANENSTCQ